LKLDIGKLQWSKNPISDADMPEFHKVFGERIEELAMQLNDCPAPSVVNLYTREVVPTMHTGRIGALFGDLESLKVVSKDWPKCTPEEAK
jgi:hypothetical protein